jgi:hypothetical protein
LLLGYTIQMCTSQKADSARLVNQEKGEKSRLSYSMRVINVSVFCLRTLHPCVRACENVVTDFQLAEILSGTFSSWGNQSMHHES